MKTKQLRSRMFTAPVVAAVTTVALAMTLSTSSFAQVKIGTNPTTITPNANLDVQGNNNTHMVVMKPGHVGINTAAPASTLHVRAIANNSYQWVNNVVAQFDPAVGSDVNVRAAIVINDRTAFGYDVDAQQSKYSFIRGNAGNDIRLQVTATDGTLQPNAFVMSAQDGRTSFIGLGTENPQSKLDIRGSLKVLPIVATQTGDINTGTSNISGVEAITSPGVAYLAIQNNGGNANLFLTKPAGNAGAGDVFQRFNVGGNSVGSISYNGAGGILFTNTSDQRLKENIRTTKFGLQALKTVKVYDYNFKTDKHKTLSTGVLAQELHKVYPQAVSVGGTDAGKDPWQVDYSKLVPMLVKSVQELSAELESTNQKVASLENEKAKLSAELKRSEELGARVSKLERMLSAEKPGESVSR